MFLSVFELYSRWAPRFYWNYSTLDSHTNTVISHAFAYSHPRRHRGSQSGWERRRDESFQVRAKEPLGTDWVPPPDWAQKMLCIIVPNRRTASPEFFFVSSYTTAIVSPNLPGSFTTLLRARKTFIFNFPNQKRRNVWDAISRSNSICPENILFLTDHNVS